MRMPAMPARGTEYHPDLGTLAHGHVNDPLWRMGVSIHAHTCVHVLGGDADAVVVVEQGRVPVVWDDIVLHHCDTKVHTKRAGAACRCKLV